MIKDYRQTIRSFRAGRISSLSLNEKGVMASDKDGGDMMIIWIPCKVPKGNLCVELTRQNSRATDDLLLAGSVSSTLMFKLRSQHVENSFCQSWRRGKHKAVRCFFEELAPLFTLGSSPWSGFSGPRGGRGREATEKGRWPWAPTSGLVGRGKSKLPHSRSLIFLITSGSSTPWAVGLCKA